MKFVKPDGSRERDPGRSGLLRRRNRSRRNSAKNQDRLRTERERRQNSLGRFGLRLQNPG